MRITVVPTLEHVAFLRGSPQGAPGVRLPEPHEVSAGLRLIHAVDAQGVMGGGAAKIAAPRALRVIGVGPRVNEELLPRDRQGERERVGVAMGRGRLISQRTGIGN